MEYNEDDFLSLGGIQHFAFCPRQWALIYIEQQWKENLRTLEGGIFTERAYFGIFDEMILQQKDEFLFNGRNKRPPLDPVNSMLSYVYTVLAHETSAAAEAAGLDAYVGFLHRDRPGRLSLGLDLMEEFRSVLADRFVLSLINRREVTIDSFSQKESGAVTICDEARKTILSQ